MYESWSDPDFAELRRKQMNDGRRAHMEADAAEALPYYTQHGVPKRMLAATNSIYERSIACFLDRRDPDTYESLGLELQVLHLASIHRNTIIGYLLTQGRWPSTYDPSLRRKRWFWDWE